MIPKTDTLIEKVIDELQISIDLLNMLTMDFDLSLIRDYGGTQRYFSVKGLYKFRREYEDYVLNQEQKQVEQRIIRMQQLIAQNIEPEAKSRYLIKNKTMDDVERYHQKIKIAGTYASELIKLQYGIHPEWLVSVFDTETGKFI